LDCGAHAADSSFQRGQQQRQLQPQQRQRPLQSIIDRPPKEITMPSPVQKTSCTGNRPTNGSNEDGGQDMGGGCSATSGSVSAPASASAADSKSGPTPAPPATSDVASDLAPAPVPATVSDSEEETPSARQKHFYGRTKRTKGTARRMQESKTMVDNELSRARDIWLMGRVSKWEYHHFCNQVHTCQQSLN